MPASQPELVKKDRYNGELNKQITEEAQLVNRVHYTIAAAAVQLASAAKKHSSGYFPVNLCRLENFPSVRKQGSERGR